MLPTDAAIQIGDKMPDGTIYAGISPDTNKPMYAEPADSSLTQKWKKAMRFAARNKAHGHRDWRVPSQNELNVLFENRAAIGGFLLTKSYSPQFHEVRYYWSSTEYKDEAGYAWVQRFDTGRQEWDYKNSVFNRSLRMVRG